MRAAQESAEKVSRLVVQFVGNTNSTCNNNWKKVRYLLVYMIGYDYHNIRKIEIAIESRLQSDIVIKQQWAVVKLYLAAVTDTKINKQALLMTFYDHESATVVFTLRT